MKTKPKLKAIINPCCKKCGEPVYWAIRETNFHSIDMLEILGDRVQNVDLLCPEFSEDSGRSFLFCENCGKVKPSEVKKGK